jgi:hypothetical protein
MAGAQISTGITIIDSLHGYLALSLTEYSTSAAASIAAGSVVEIAGAFFSFPADELIEASTWTSIVTGNTAYIALTASGTAGSQVVTATYTGTAPTWRDDLQGWYASAASTVRVVGSVYKAEATNYGPKYVFAPDQVSYFPKIRSYGAISAGSSLSVSGVASCSSSLSVSGTISCSSSISIAGLTHSNGFSLSNATNTLGTTYSFIYASLALSLVSSNKSIIVSGAIRDGSGKTAILSLAGRNTTGVISLYGYETSTPSLYTLDLTSGSAIVSGPASFSW